MMSSAKLVLVEEEALRNELECPVCMEEPRLHLLPCAHRCCMTCVDRLAGAARKIECPVCRRQSSVPPEGFPVCPVTEHIKDALNMARVNGSEVKQQAEAAEEEERCEGCSDGTVDSRCSLCLKFLCFRCGMSERKCGTGAQKHDCHILEEVFSKSETRLRDRMADIQIKVETATASMNTLNRQTKSLREKRTDLQKQLDLVHEKIEKAEEQQKAGQRELDIQMSCLSATAIVLDSENSIGKIGLTDMMCDEFVPQSPETSERKRSQQQFKQQERAPFPSSRNKGDSKKKFQTIDINSVYKGKGVVTRKAVVSRGHGLEGLKKVAARRMPPPINLPSLKSEINGNDPTVNLVPTGPGTTWGDGKQATRVSSRNQQEPMQLPQSTYGEARGPTTAWGMGSSSAGVSIASTHLPQDSDGRSHGETASPHQGSEAEMSWSTVTKKGLALDTEVLPHSAVKREEQRKARESAVQAAKIYLNPQHKPQE